MAPPIKLYDGYPIEVIGPAFRLLREAQDYSADEFAKAIGTSQHSLRIFERAQRKEVSIEKLQIGLELLHVDSFRELVETARNIEAFAPKPRSTVDASTAVAPKPAKERPARKKPSAPYRPVENYGSEAAGQDLWEHWVTSNTTSTQTRE